MTSHQGAGVAAGAISTIIDSVVQHPYLACLAFFGTICIFTRVQSGLEASSTSRHTKSGPQPVPSIPYWLPWIGHLIPFAIGFQKYLKSIDDRTRNGIFSLRIAGSTHNFITSASLMKELSTRNGLPVTMDGMVFYLMENFFADRGAIKEVCKTSEGYDLMMVEAHGALASMMREPFLNYAVPRAVEAVQNSVWNLISGNASWVDQAPWERAGKVDIVAGSDARSFVAEADMHVLLRDWVGHIASTLLMGRAFMENNPNALQDLWLMDSRFNKFLLGLPAWMVPGLPPASAARERLYEAILEHHQAMIKVQDDEDPGSRYDDMSDVPQVMWDRVTALRKSPRDARFSRALACSDLSFLWAMNVNANQVIYWMIFYLYSDRVLLTDIREEISPYVKIEKPVKTGLPVAEAPNMSIDIDALMQKCPLLKSAFYETMRIETSAPTYKTIVEDMVITESMEDAKLAGRQEPRSFILRKDEMVCIPNGVHQESSVYFSDPEKFDARRFWSKSGDEKDGIVKVENKTMRVWGGGKTMCKGKNFAEREVLMFVAAITMCWEMEPVSRKWKHPGRLTNAGTAVPKRDTRVRLWRRDLW